MKPRYWRLVLLLLVGMLSFCLVALGWQKYQTSEIIIEWSTASELNTVGYNIYRSLAEDQVGEKINAMPIPVKSDLLSGNEYSYSDQQVQVGTQYYYWLEDIARDGKTTRNGPIEVEAKRDPMGLLLILLGLAAFLSIAFVFRFHKNTGDGKLDHLPATNNPSGNAGSGL